MPVRYEVSTEFKLAIEELALGANAKIGQPYERWDGQEVFLFEIGEWNDQLVAAVMLIEKDFRPID
jgi:hypothetical protein